MARRGSAASASSGRWTTSSRGRRTPAPAPTLSPWASARSAPAAPCGRRAALARGLPGRMPRPALPRPQPRSSAAGSRPAARAPMPCGPRRGGRGAARTTAWAAPRRRSTTARRTISTGRGCGARRRRRGAAWRRGAAAPLRRHPRGRRGGSRPSSPPLATSCSIARLATPSASRAGPSPSWSGAAGTRPLAARSGPAPAASLAWWPWRLPRAQDPPRSRRWRSLSAPRICWAAPRCWRAASLRWAHGRRAAAVPGRDGGRPRSTPRSGR
mmetsp:Transcript_5733/g.15607  ORF Transcript_5733/g.15607 Transcript_5733/m.15607 type:complete len:270 (-) Transcript_5733:416-1225(-)